MDLPTYTNIWRIEKRLYKLYDLRLPMPLPLVQIGVFVGVFVPWIVLLRLAGIPFQTPWHVLYLVPPGVLTWMATRPVIEGKRLTELLLSQGRYLTEPRTWCRLTPIREPSEVVVVARVWRSRDRAVVPEAVPERAAIRAGTKGRKARKAGKAKRGKAATMPVAPAYTAAARTAEAALAAHRPQPLAEYAAHHAPAVTESPWPAESVAPPRPVHQPPEAEQQVAEPAPGRERARQAEREGTARRVPAPATWRQPVTPALALVPEPEPAAERPPEPGVERPPATPLLEVPPARERPQGSGKRAFASGVVRSGNPAEFWPVAAPGTPEGPAEPGEPAEPAERPEAAQIAEATGATDGVTGTGTPQGTAPSGDTAVEQGSAGSARPAPDTRPDIPLQRPAERRPAIPAVPTAFGTAGRPDGQAATDGAGPQESGTQEPGTQEPGTDDRAAVEAGPARAGGTAGDAQAAQRSGPRKEPETESAREPIREPSVKPPSKPWSKELSRPRAAGSDALVWPPVGADPATPDVPGRRPAASGRADEPAAVTALPPRTGPGRPIKPAPPQVVPQPRPPHPGDERSAEPAPPPPAREVRSGPASPVRPRPLPQPVPPPAPEGPAITPPDPEHEPQNGGLRRLLKAVGGGHGDADSEWEERLQRPFHGTRHIVVLGCTGGAGQTVTALMLGHTFATHGSEPVVAIDVNPGPGALARRTRSETNETLTGLITRADQISSLTAMRRYTSRAKSGLDVVAAGRNPLHALDDRDYALAIRTLDRFYSVTLLDTAAAVVARVLPHADQLVLVAPASADAPRAVAMTYEWLDGHGYDDLRSRAVTVINGVSRRSMDDVEQAEAVARGRCRALVRIPWDDHLSLDRSPRNELKSLRSPTRRAYLALAGVVAGGFGDVPERYQEQEQEASR